MSSSANIQQNWDSNLGLLTLYCYDFIGRDRWCIFIKFLLCARPGGKSLLCLVSILHFTDEETGVPRGEAIGTKPHRQGSELELIASYTILQVFSATSTSPFQQEKQRHVISQQGQREGDLTLDLRIQDGLLVLSAEQAARNMMLAQREDQT